MQKSKQAKPTGVPDKINSAHHCDHIHSGSLGQREKQESKKNVVLCFKIILFLTMYQFFQRNFMLLIKYLLGELL